MTSSDGGKMKNVSVEPEKERDGTGQWVLEKSYCPYNRTFTKPVSRKRLSLCKWKGRHSQLTITGIR